jgi:phosphatidylinositol 4-phosphatase
VNCLDNLDRTNVVQSSISKIFIEKVLDLEINSELYNVFRNMWADHADCISNLYTGTNALKTVFFINKNRIIQGMKINNFKK